MGNRVLTLSDIEQHEIVKWVSDQLRRLEQLVIENGSDEELLRVVEYLQDDNDRSRISYVEKLVRSGALFLPENQHNPH